MPPGLHIIFYQLNTVKALLSREYLISVIPQGAAKKGGGLLGRALLTKSNNNNRNYVSFAP